MIYIDRKVSTPLYVQIYQQLKNEIVTGIIPTGTLLAGSRTLAKTLGVSRNTVDVAYSQLLAEGYVNAKKGVGLLVISVPKLNSSLPSSKQPKASKTIHRHKESQPHIIYDLTNVGHSQDLFPKKIWRKFTLDSLDLLEEEQKLSVLQDKQGDSFLRQALIKYLAKFRGVQCEEDQLVITGGLQQSLNYLCLLLEGKKNLVLMEEPGYIKARTIFEHHHLAIKSIPIDKEGLLVSQLPTNEPFLGIYTTPSHQFPTGAVMPISRRIDLLNWASANNTYIFEDDFDSELRYYSHPIPSLQSIDQNERVIYLGTFSKGLSPSLRMSYLILPPHLVTEYQTKFVAYNSSVPLLNQYTVAKLIESGEYERHMRRMNQIFKKRADTFVEEFKSFGQNVELSSNVSGQYFLLHFSKEIDQQKMIQLAENNGVRVYSTMQFWHDKAACPPHSLFLGFSKILVSEIPDCVSRLKVAWKEYL
ncbi:GntR family transcriptional regulator/MocR family aminotransferase [Enterococcus sp. AZ194]|uniref:MocR-like pyridoxine biosynthesis transcription factor PdxR n=1 Tax=Enterococcus sp. AZ194 TaxID=2774629 RepID=UPI003F2584C0